MFSPILHVCAIDLWNNYAFYGAYLRAFVRAISTQGFGSVTVVPYLEMNCPREAFQKGAFGPNFVPIVSSDG